MTLSPTELAIAVLAVMVLAFGIMLLMSTGRKGK
jgi:hypothetical protein